MLPVLVLPFNFVVLGDTRSRHDVHAKIVNRIIQKDPLLIVNTGDLVKDGQDKKSCCPDPDGNKHLRCGGPILKDPFKGIGDEPAHHQSEPLVDPSGNKDGDAREP